ncbi:MBL fold metallo-hydrolase [Sphingomonas sp.]|uniref:MBL fold metallo-hydrolase n=1 Tax=Sphingomonas sp. TaxID=28214 RepID=UPI0035BBC8C1
MTLVLKIIGVTLLVLVILLALAAAIVPRFLDRRYYQGPPSDHFDGARFFNPDGDSDTAGIPGGGGRAGFIWRQLTGSDGRPAWPESVPVTPSKPAARVAGEAMVATWIGHATVLVQTQGMNILTDPVYAERAGPLGFGPRRVTAPGVAFDDLPPIDLVLLSHNHYDHLDLDTLERLWRRDRPTIVTPLGNDAILRAHGIESQAADWGESLPVSPRAGGGPFEVTVTRNHHWGSRWGTDRNRALWSSFVVRLPGGNLFFAGDTGWGDGKWPGEAAKLGPIRLALIPIGAFRFVPGQMSSGSHIGPAQAVDVFRASGAATAIPIHWGTFRLSYEARDTPSKMLEAAVRCSGIADERPDKRFAPVVIGRAVQVPGIAPVVVPSRVIIPPQRSGADLLRCLDTPEVRALR